MEHKDYENMTYEDFMDDVWGRVSELVVSDKYFDKNKDLVYSLVSEYYTIFNKTKHLNISTNFYAKLLESTLHCVIKNTKCDDYTNDAYDY